MMMMMMMIEPLQGRPTMFDARTLETVSQRSRNGRKDEQVVER